MALARHSTMPQGSVKTTMSVPWGHITVGHWAQNTSAGTCRQHNYISCTLSTKDFQGSVRCEKKKCNIGEILDEEGLCMKLSCGTGFEPGPLGNCIVKYHVYG